MLLSHVTFSGACMPREGSDRKSLTIDSDIIEFIKEYVDKHRIELAKAGKDTHIVSFLREAFFTLLEKKGLEKEFEEFLARRRKP